MTECACGSGRAFESCCQPYINGAPAPTAEALMRSRYTAMSLGHLDHIERTSTEKALRAFNRVDMESSIPNVEWLGLEVTGRQDGGPDDDEGIVTFGFRYRFQDRDHAQREIARLQRVDGIWLYDESEINPKSPPVEVKRVGRNEPCPCGSGKKYKKCCGGPTPSGAA